MMRFLSLIFALLVTGPAFAQSVTLPAEVKGGAGSWVIIAPEKVDGGALKWRIDPGLQEVRLDLLLPPEMLARLKGKVVTGQPGRYRVECWTAKGDVPSDIATCWVVIGGGPSPVPPGPTPDPPKPDPPKPDPPAPSPSATKLSIVVVYESADLTAQSARVLQDLDFWRAIEVVGHKWYKLDKDQKDKHGNRIVEANGYAPFVDKVGLPAILYLDQSTGKVVWHARLPLATAEIRGTINSLTGKQ